MAARQCSSKASRSGCRRRFWKWAWARHTWASWRSSRVSASSSAAVPARWAKARSRPRPALAAVVASRPEAVIRGFSAAKARSVAASGSSARFMAESDGAGVVGRLKGILVGEDWIYVLSLLVPLVVYNVALKVVRVATQFGEPGPLGFLDQVRSDLLFNLGYAVLWIGILAAVRGRAGRLVALGLFHVISILVVVLTTIAHVFFEKTGSTLDLSFIVASLSSFGEVRGAIASETTLMHWLVIPIAVLYGVFGPAVVTRLATHRWHAPTRSAGRPWTVLPAACLAALALFSLSLLPSATGAGNAFSRDAIANMIVSEIATPKVKAKLAGDSLPTDTEFAR